MSSHHEDPHEKKDTPSESSESHSDSEAEENLEQLKRGKRLTKEAKDDPGESKPLGSPNQVGTLTSKCDPFNEPIAGPSGLQEPRLESSDAEFKVEGLSDPQKEKSVEAKGLEENIEARRVEEDSESASSTSLFILSSTGETPSMLQEKSPVSGSSGLRDEVDLPKLPTYACSIYTTKSRVISSPRHFDYASDAEHTSLDVSEIRSEIADISTGGALQSSSESTEPKSSSSSESHRKESPEIESSLEVQECSKSKGRKSWQTPGLLRSMQLPAMPSKESVIAEEEDRASRLREQDTEFIETKDPTLDKMETTLDEGVSENKERSESKPAIESSDLVGGSKAGGTLKEHEQSSEVPELKRSIRKYKREPTLSSSTSSDEEQSSSPPKASTSRPKRARYDKMPGKTRRTRHDSGGSVPKRVSLDNPEQSEPKSTTDSSDFTPSYSSSETAP